MTSAPALLSQRTVRLWLALNVAGALLLNSLIFTHW
jgi:methylthioxylose transferase